MSQIFNNCKLIPVSALMLVMFSCKQSNPDIQGGNSDPVRVKVMSVTFTSPTTAMSELYSGTVEAGNSTTISFSVAGTINKMNVKEGQKVGKGQLIATVDGASLKNANEIAEATLREAQDAYARMKKLHDANALPDMQWVAVQEKLKQAQAAADIAKTGMNDANLYSPISGVVSHKLADVGQTVAPGFPIVELLDMNTLKVKISVPESDLKEMTIGTEATVTAGENDSHSYSAKLVDKAVAANSLSRNYDIKFQILNPDDYLLPGMICNVNVAGVAPQADAVVSEDIVLPPQAVVLDFDNTHYVWVKKNGLAERRKVTVGGLDSRGIVITGGINATDSVIVEGQQKLSSGLKVESVN